ncbi:MAG: hypothetical protein AABX51_04405 [Nanoarchaeota archaeon]
MEGMGMCSRCKGSMMIAVGILVLANVYFLYQPWALFIAGILVVGGILKLIMPKCGHVTCCTEEKKVTGGKKKK